jgi:CheY-like chemotaxis protein
MADCSGERLSAARTILFVEDEIRIRASMSEFLREHGYRVLEAGDAEEALNVFNAGIPIDAVFADIMMPGAMNGFALARRIRSIQPGIQIVLTSGVPLSLGLAAGLGDGEEILAKPYSLEDLLSHIDVACSKALPRPGKLDVA